MTIMKMNTGMTSTGMITTGMTVTGCIIHMDTTVYIMSGGIPGGGIIIGGGHIGAITSTGISSTVDFMWYGMKTAAGGSGPDTADG